MNAALVLKEVQMMPYFYRALLLTTYWTDKFAPASEINIDVELAVFLVKQSIGDVRRFLDPQRRFKKVQLHIPAKPPQKH